jgi:hypothetical protein
MKRGCLVMSLLLLIFAIFLILNLFVSFERPKPIPKDKEAFIGLWRTQSGFQIEIDSSGIADAIPIIDHNNPDFKEIDPGLSPEYAKEMIVGFKGDSIFSVSKPKVRSKSYRIDKNPYMDGDTCKMVLNGVLLIK